MLKIKLQPTGKRDQRYYRIVVAPDRSKLTGQYIDKLGSYDPSNPKNKLEIDLKLYQAWLKKGAQPTDTIKKLIDKNKWNNSSNT